MSRRRKFSKRINRRYNVCERKRRFGSYSAAMDELQNVSDTTGDKDMKVYQCPFCRAYHFGHPRKYE